MQNEIKNKQPLLDENGHLINPGFARKMMYEYNRNSIKASKFKIKEWDYYLINNDDYGIAFTISDNSYLGFISVTLLDFKQKTFDAYSKLVPFTFGKLNLPSSTLKGNVSYQNKKISMSFKTEENKRILSCKVVDFKNGKDLESKIILSEVPEESMVIATPFKENKKAFYFNQKINCMKADGYVSFGEQEIEFNDAYGVLDWGRGVWTYNNTWFWSTASGKINNIPFGLNLGYGFGDLANATENMIFYSGKSHKIDKVTFNIPKTSKKHEFLKEWELVSNDNRLYIKFTPILDRCDKISLGLLVSDQHQVFGTMNGYAILDDGTKLEIKDLLGSAEMVHNKW